jgi:hypothetical protein
MNNGQLFVAKFREDLRTHFGTIGIARSLKAVLNEIRYSMQSRYWDDVNRQELGYSIEKLMRSGLLVITVYDLVYKANVKVSEVKR